MIHCYEIKHIVSFFAIYNKKNFKLRPPLFPYNEKKSSINHKCDIRSHIRQQTLHLALYQQSHRVYKSKVEIFVNKNDRNVFAGF